MTVKVIKFAPGLRPVFKHGTGDQKPHGSWAENSVSFKQDKSLISMNDKTGKTLASVTFVDLGYQKLDINSIDSYEEGKGYATRVLDNLYSSFPNHSIFWGKTIIPASTHLAEKFASKYGRTTYIPWGEGAINGKEMGKLYGQEEPVTKHGTHDQKTHGNWSIGRSDAWSVETKANETTLSQERDRTLLKVTIPNKLLSDSKYKESVESALTTIEKLHTDYPINTEVKFRDGELQEAKFLAETWSTNMVYGVVTTQTSQINIAKRFFSEDREVQTHTLTHEWGHAVDSRTKDVSKQQADKLSLAQFNDASIPMTDYGFTSTREAYAEAFAIKVNNSHKGGIYSSRVQQTPKWEEVFKIFELDSFKKALGERVSFKVWDTFDANNPPKLIEDYEPAVLKHQVEEVLKHGEHDQQTHGNWADGTPEGGNGLSHKEIYNLQVNRSDPLQRKVYGAEEKHQPEEQRDLPIPIAPKMSDYDQTQKDDYAYDKAYKEYSKKHDEWSRETTRNIQSDFGKKHLDGTVRGVQGYINDVTRSDWFKQKFGDGGVVKAPTVALSDIKVAGKYSIGTTNGLGYSKLTINKGYSQAEPLILHELTHYANAISQSKGYDSHGIEFAKNYIYVASRVIGSEYAAGLEKAYRGEGIDLGN